MGKVLSLNVGTLTEALVDWYLSSSNGAERFAFILITSMSFLVSYAVLYGTLRVALGFLTSLF